jgi:hypothetical protein
MIGHPRAYVRAIIESYKVRRVIHLLQNRSYKPLKPHESSSNLPEVMVSLTTYGDRLQTVDLAIKSILAGSVQPNRIVLWLDNDTNSVLPESLVELQNLGVEIRRGIENLGAHKKYFYAFKENPNSIVITIDDDVMYPTDTVETLLKGYNAHPGCIIARRVHRMLYDSNLKILPYQQWDWEWQKGSDPRMDIIALGVGAVLYPPHPLRSDVLDADAIKAYAQPADDIWLKVNEVLKGIPTAWAPCDKVHPWTIPNSQKTALYSSNVGGGRNDLILRDTLNYFGVSERDFIALIKVESKSQPNK